MNKILMMTCGMLMVSSVVFADDVSVETCANEAGKVVTGISGHRYCMSNNSMNWWNALSWCDAQGRHLMGLDNCNHSGVDETWNCPELIGVGEGYVLMATSIDPSKSFRVLLSSGRILDDVRKNGYYALCY